ncbi:MULTISPECIES: hypothetical protein [Delftia]|uniref:hypothetical protein n=1 Tax=Delftia TaxID=80865 RepID=UPI00289E295F|nr:hypothetical protein [Delftia tsuruhatensis]
MNQINWLGWGVGATQVLLCGALAMAWLTPQMEIKNSRWQPPEPIKADVQALLPKQPETPEPGIRQEDQLMLQMQERPLFALSRRPPPPPPPPPKKSDEEPVEQDQWSKAKVLGLFDGAVTGAIVQYAGKEQRFMLSQSLGGWKLSRVLDREIELERGGRKRRLPITRAAMDKGPAIPANVRVPSPPAPVARVPRGGSYAGQQLEAEQPQNTGPAPQEEGASLGGGIVR